MKKNEIECLPTKHDYQAVTVVSTTIQSPEKVVYAHAMTLFCRNCGKQIWLMAHK